MFSLIIGNSDEHGKNYSLLYEKGQKQTLSPLYDLASISGMMLFHPEAAGSSRLARPIGRAWFAADLTPWDMLTHAHLFGASIGDFAEMFGELVENIGKKIPEVVDGTVALLKSRNLKRLVPEAEFLGEHIQGRLEEFFLDFAEDLRKEANKAPDAHP